MNTTTLPPVQDSIAPDTPTEQIAHILSAQNQFFQSGATLAQAFRVKQLTTLKQAIHAYHEQIEIALKQDLNKSVMETYVSEVALVLDEIDFMLKHLAHLMKPKHVKTPTSHFPAKSLIMYEPYGRVLNIAPWNYPFQLCIAPIVGAMAAGNTVILKPSEYAPHTSAVVAKLFAEYFEPQYIAVIEGGVETTQILLQHQFDYIFFTGSTAVGKIVMRAASEHLTPVTLELGGKSPCIIDSTADIAQAAKRIMWGKALNSGQTCIAPDYIWVHESVKTQLVQAMQQAVTEMYGTNPLQNPDYPRMINQKHYHRVKAFLQDGTIVVGGDVNDTTLQISPTVLTDVTWQSPVMQEEIFGAVLPLMTFNNIDQVISDIKAHAKPLALYLFTKDSTVEDKVLNLVPFGGGCVNDTLMHIANHHLPFGGVGASGMGAYHGEFSFYTFSHAKAILKRGTWIDVPVRYPPYTPQKLAILRKMM
jgi:aldehyde dehydrogenase (NAD+)